MYESGRMNDKKLQPPLHLAVLHDDVKALQLLCYNEEAMKRKNSLGFTAIEFAKLLGKYELVKLVQPDIKHKIMIRLKGSDQLCEYTVEEFERIFGVSYIEANVFFTLSFLEQVINDCPWLLAHTVFGFEHRRLGSYLRTKVSQGFVEDVSIAWIDDTIGYGLFAAKALEKESYIGEYVGVVRKINRFSPEYNEYCLHYPSRFFSYNYYCIDAEHAGNETRFINHSDTPNLKPVCILDRNLLHIVFFTLRAIAEGEELCFDYGKSFWRKRQKR